MSVGGNPSLRGESSPSDVFVGGDPAIRSRLDNREGNFDNGDSFTQVFSATLTPVPLPLHAGSAQADKNRNGHFGIIQDPKTGQITDIVVGGDPSLRRHSDDKDRYNADRNALAIQLGSAQADLAEKLAEMRRMDTQHLHGDIIAAGTGKLAHLRALADQLVGGATDVAALRAEIASAVADIRAYTSDVRAANTASASSSQQAGLYQASEAARGSVNDFMHDYYDQKKFERYLQFTSTEDEQDYRKREEERKQAIDKALAEHTPEGSLKANQLSIEQLKDAGAHGADRSPDYKPMLRSLEDSRDNLSAQLSNSKATKQERDNAAAVTAPEAGQGTADAKTADAIARFRSQVSLADQGREGHGLTSVTRPASGGPTLPSH